VNTRSRRILLTLTFVALAASLAANLWLGRGLRTRYVQLSELTLDPLGLGYYGPVTAPTNRVVVMLGDSRAFAWPAPALPPGVVFHQRGIGQQTTAQILGRFSAHVAPLRPSVVVIQAGVNDLKTLGVFPDRRADLVAGCLGNLRALVTRSRALGARVVLTTIFPSSKVPLARRPVWSPDIPAAIDEVNRGILAMAGEGVTVFDAAALLKNPDGSTRHECYLDTLHLNPTGYAALGQELERLLNPADTTP
jgi:lysophospholipase L1-like esterase